MKSYTHFTLFERECLQELRKEGKSFREIGLILGKHASSVCREYNRNFSKKKKRYHPWRATILYIQRRKRCVRKPALAEGTDIYEFVMQNLKKYWSPELISKIGKRKGYTISFNTIYRAVRTNKFEGIKANTHFRRKNKKKHAKHGNHATIHPERTIHDRPDVVDLKIRLGDWEGDTICGANNKSCLVTAVDRVSKMLCAAISPNHTKEAVRAAMKKAFSQIEGHLPIHTLTLDNGSEFADFKGIEDDLGTTIYFADPHSPWQRGLNENTNDILRFFFPKGTDFNNVSDDDVNWALSLINTRPRKCLDFLSPLDFISFKCCT